MKKKITLKDTQIERTNYRARLKSLILIILLFVLALVVRLFYLQITHHHRYMTLSTQNQIAVIPIAPARGLIFDRNGALLAKNKAVFSLDIIPYKTRHLHQLIAKLQQVVPLDADDIHEFYKTLRQKRAFEPVPLKYNLSETEIANFAVNQWRFPGVMINARLLRFYPYNQSFAHVLGFMGRIDMQELVKLDPINYSATNYIGKAGIEKHYESMLHGQVGYQQVEIDASGHIVRILKRTPPVSGTNLYLTIDTGLQLAAEKALGENHGAVVAIEPSTGQVLAMVSTPSFDPNTFVNGISAQAYQKLLKSPAQPLYNRAIRGLFATGSIIKPFISVKALAMGTITPNTTIYDPGYFTYADHLYHDWNWKKGGHGYVNVAKAIIVSCDTFFYHLAVNLGVNNLDDILFSFGFGKLTGIDVEGELPGVVPTPQWKLQHIGHHWYTGDTINMDVGQGYLLATPIQMAKATATLAERGESHQPSLVLSTAPPVDQTIETSSMVEEGLKIPADDWDLVIRAMQKVITSNEGTGYHFGRNPPYTVAAKTGTAQVYSTSYHNAKNNKLLPVNLRDNSLFITFAPADHPKIAVAVLDEHSEHAAAVARKVLDYYLLTEKHLSGNYENNDKDTRTN